jgi:hypothetical protein
MNKYVTALVSFAGGIALTFVVMVVSAYANAYTLPQGYNNEHEIYARYLKLSMFLWFAVTAMILIFNAKKVKLNSASLVLRQIFLWGPISLGWIFTVNGYDGVLTLGILFSSITLSYQIFVWRNQ